MLFTLKAASPKLRKAIIQNCHENLLKAIQEIVLNVLRGNVKLTPKNKSSLQKYKKQLRAIAYSGKKNSNKKKLLTQQGAGAFLPILLGTILSGILSDFLSNHNARS